MSYVFLILLLSGGVGGVAGYFLYGGQLGWELVKHMLLGVCASLMVPLFLKTISSRLIPETILESGFISENHLVLVGFCLVASISAQKFIKLMSANIIKELEEVKATAQEAQVKAESALGAADSNIEPDPDVACEEAAKKLNSVARDVLVHILNGPYTMRSATGLSQEMHIAVPHVNNALKSLADIDFVREGVNAKSKKRWYLTASGKREALKINGEGSLGGVV